MNEELTLAIDELRQRPTERAWFIPVLLSECQVPARNIGAGETLRDIQWVELYRDWEEGIARIAATIDPDAQIVQPPRMKLLTEEQWGGLIGQLRNGVCVPILGSKVNYGLAALARKWARDWNHPEWIGLSFAEVAEKLDQSFGREEVIFALQEEYARAKVHDFNLVGDLHAVASGLPCSVFITTCFDRFLEDALITRGKHPLSVAPRDRHDVWSEPAVDSLELFRPTVREPLVLHVFGRIDVDDSLVLTVDDHMLLLRDGSKYDNIWPIFACRSVANGAPMWLGFDLDSLEFLVMRTLMRTLVQSLRPKVIHRYRPIVEPKEKEERGVLLYEFMTELRSRLEKTSGQD
jgi:hypothetical protein